MGLGIFLSLAALLIAIGSWVVAFLLVGPVAFAVAIALLLLLLVADVLTGSRRGLPASPSPLGKVISLDAERRRRAHGRHP